MRSWRFNFLKYNRQLHASGPPQSSPFPEFSHSRAKWQVSANEKLVKYEMPQSNVSTMCVVIEKAVCEPASLSLSCAFLWRDLNLYWHSTKPQVNLGPQKVNLLEIPAFSNTGSILRLQNSLARSLALLC